MVFNSDLVSMSVRPLHFHSGNSTSGKYESLEVCSCKVICLIRLFYSGRATTTEDDDGVGLSERSRLWPSQAVIAAEKVHPGNYLRSEERKMQYGTYQLTKFNKRCS